MKKYHFGLILSVVFLLSGSFSPSFGFTILVPQDTSIPGCEVTNECFIPPVITSYEGVVITWFNGDSAAHTVTSGSPVNGPTGVFDSGLFQAGTTFDYQFDETGTFDYFCMVHPWMKGSVNIIDDDSGITKILADNNPKVIHVGEEIVFDASKSRDNSGNILRYEWWFLHNDLDLDYYDIGRIVYPKFSSPGNYDVILQLTTDYGLVDWDFTTINVLPELMDEPLSEPVPESTSKSTITEHYGDFPGKITSVVINYPSEIHAGEPVIFDTSGTFDSEGEISEYHWWFYSHAETDTFNYDMRYGESPKYTFSSSGTMMVEYEFVTDYKKYEGGSFAVQVLPPSNELPNTTEPDPELNCGAGTMLINGQCEKIRENTGPDLILIIVGIIIAAVAGIAISRSRKSSSSKTSTETILDSKGSGNGRECNVCGTIIPEGKNVCPNCGDTYSV